MHPAGMPKLAHSCIYDGVAGFSFLPGAQFVYILAPGKDVEFGPERLIWQAGKMKKQMIGEFAPSELPKISFRCGISARGSGRASSRNGIPNLARAYLAKGEMR